MHSPLKEVRGPMKRRWNVPIWTGFLTVVAGVVTYFSVFVRFASTRDFPWVNLLMLGGGLALLVYGVVLAYRRPLAYHGRITGAILLGLSLAASGFFVVGVFYFARQLPASGGAPRVGQKAPDFTLPDKDGDEVTLSKLLASGVEGADPPRGVVLIFYRGHW